MKLIIASATLISALILTGCDEQPKSKQWYMDNPEEAKVQVDKCKASGDDSVNCRNAKSALFQIKQESAPVADLN
ncbi:EexN family lipoprotein [Salmonella enterica subsp. enterica serovar Anatum]|uniref:Eex protein n=2 Tax=Salmonella enterica TaxID=28901 RepID=A0A5W1Z791_SALNE|nr:EexN family lipoprotein [Salmonella enterica]EBW3121601.1 Eex protein [Salmonella enterica subsp. enterica serovar Newport]ECX3460468.1 EexN family lipoprotein [Salmonella enterica subsp. enterica serovar Litchfield]EDI4712608.1 Eex protein [Salmonella enterica subsp. enterica serovar Montevideo]EDR4932240.1 EexN family lipoprotein [Salmonella enterica subsp. enterica serovar Braenderup]EDU1140991.1 EexN family lipoprotein [Salmonella enterica subsp. enterica serovar Anatum]EDW4359493.1 Ee